MQQKYVTRDRYVLILALFIFTIGTYSLFANTNSKSLFEVTTFQNQVKGLVTDSNGIPIPGVTIQIKGTSKGTFTNDKGEFIINASPTNILVLTYIGFKTLEVVVGNPSELSLVLQEDITSLDAVTVNAGYYTIKERERTGSISRVTAEEIEMQPVINPIQAIQGRMAGVEITSGGNLPGMAPTIQIRGTNSLRDEGNYPLYIIDGMPINSIPIESFSNLGVSGIDPLNAINLSNIESIEVLKDADATAIYGSRGANGVILITTKRGFQGKTKIDVDIYSGLSSVPNKLNLLNTEQYLRIRKKAFENDGVEPTESNAYDLLVWDQKRYTDWQSLFFKRASSITNLNLSASGGNSTTNYRLNGSYHKQGTIYPGDYDYNKITGGVNVNHISENQKLAINLAINYGVDKNNQPGYINYRNAFSIPPNGPAIFNEDGGLNWAQWGKSGMRNPLEGYFNESQTETENLITNLGISYHITNHLRFKIYLGYTHLYGNEIIKRPKKSYNPDIAEGSAHRSVHSKSERKSWIIEPQLSYNVKLGKGKIEALLGATFQKRKNTSLNLAGEGYASESFIGNLNAADNIISLSNQNIEYKYAATFARLGYNLNKKYLINFTARRDGSSRFGPGKQFANFGAIGGAWIFSEEPFVRNNFSFISFGKLRGSYGTAGNDQIGDYGYLDAYSPTSGPNGLYPTELANPNYSWEVNKKLEVALELGFFKDKVSLETSYYRNRSSNQLVGYPLPAMAGFTTVQANLAATVQNTGWEIVLSTSNFRNRNFHWQTFLNISFPENKLISYPNINESSFSNTYRIGYPLNIDLLYSYDGINPETGYYRIADINKDGRFDYKDRINIKVRDRQYFGGISNVIKYKEFFIQFLWEFVKQNGRLTMFYPGEFANQREETIQALEDGSKFQIISQQGLTTYNYALNTNMAYTDASYLRLKTLSIGYTLPILATQSLGIQSCRLYLSGYNLVSITSYEGMDPEIADGGTSFSNLRTITLGAQFKF